VIVGLAVGLAVGVCAGLVTGYLLWARAASGALVQARLSEARLSDAQGSVARLEAQHELATRSLAELKEERARLEAEVDQVRRTMAERDRAWAEDRDRLTGTFAQLSNEALRSSTEQLLNLADAKFRDTQEAARNELGQHQAAIAQQLEPLKDLLARYESELQEMERKRQGAYSGLTEQVRTLATTQEQLRTATQNLVTALRAPQTRGRWGELQLRRVVELAGMMAHCDFDEQVTTASEDGRLRPDMVVHLPGGANVVVDAKVPLDGFLRAAETEDQTARREHLAAHARQLRAHVDQLAKREYWRQFDPSPDFVVAFVPGDALVMAAFEHDGELLEHAMANRVVIATPTSLIGLLRVIALSWRDEAMAANARAVQELGAELYDRLRVFGGHLSRMHQSLAKTVQAFNEAVGSLESRVLVTARRFPNLSVVGHDAKGVPELQPVTESPRVPQAPELVERATEPGRPALDVVLGDLEEGELPGRSGVG
jgi:DNA recombination protein RmuC